MRTIWVFAMKGSKREIHRKVWRIMDSFDKNRIKMFFDCKNWRI